ncbi:MAG: GAF domain-containing protein, partial [Terracidiphilus sp.]
MHEQPTVAAEPPARGVWSGSSYIQLALVALAGALVLGLVLGVVAPRLAVNFQYNRMLIFAAGAAAAALVLRLMVQREQRQALQRTVSQIVGEDASPEVAIARILEALCVSHGWDAALEWKVNDPGNQLEFRSAWGAPGERMRSLIQESAELTLAGRGSLPGAVWLDDHPVWIPDLNSMPLCPHAQSALNHGMVSGWAVPVRVGNRVVAVLEFYCHSAIREDREALAAVETAAASLGQMRARSHEHGRAEELYRRQEILLDSVADGICGVDPRGLV